MNEIGGTTPAPGPARGSAVLRYAAFTDHGGGGNPAGVVLDAAGLDDSARLAIAARVGYSETAFAEAADGAGQYRIRYFSPRAEVAFCGHATIAAAVAADATARGCCVSTLAPARSPSGPAHARQG